MTDTTRVTDAAKADLNKSGVRLSVDGVVSGAKGKVEDAAGALAGDPTLQAKGKLDQAKGIVEKQVGGALRSASKTE